MIYKITKGRHGFDLWGRPSWADDFYYRVKFNESAVYKINDEDQGDINKLCGFCDGLGWHDRGQLDFHHNNSARFGWRYINSRLELWAYCYVNRVRNVMFICNIDDLSEAYWLRIFIIGNQYVFEVYDSHNKLMATNVMQRGKGSVGNFKYRLYPYFGGNQVAPHDMTIDLSHVCRDEFIKNT